MKTAQKLWKINEHLLLLDRVSEKVCGLVSWHPDVGYYQISHIFCKPGGSPVSRCGVGWDGGAVLSC